MRAKQCVCFNINNIAGEGLVPVKCMLAPPPRVAKFAVRSMSVVLLLLIHF